ATAPMQQNFTDIKPVYGTKMMEASKCLPLSAVANKVQKIQNRYSANRAAAEFAGSYLTTAVDGFDGYEMNGAFTVEEGNLLNGFGGWSSDTDFREEITFVSVVKADVQENGDLVFELGQVLGKWSGPYNGTDVNSDIMLIGRTEEGWVTEGKMTFAAKEDGSYVCDLQGMGVAFPVGNSVVLFDYELSPKIMKPNATATYNWIAGNGTDKGNFNVPMFIGFEDEEFEGVTYTTMYMSALLYELTGDGYPATYEVEEADNGFEAIANSPICVYNEDNSLVEGGNIVYGQLATSIKTYTSDVIWNLSTKKDAIELSVQEIRGQSGTGNTDCLYIHNDGYTFGQLWDVKIDMSNAGVQEIIADAAAENGAVEYYNLQGMKINNPAAGQIVIRRQGNKTAKMIVR
ncbi:MAG: hypothetical protein K2L93_05500, partial [Muribaculaceae bacterium]|nr:hypothetical protein [Muribaculaceae bacterium]